MSSENDVTKKRKAYRTRSCIGAAQLKMDEVPKTPSRKTVTAELPKTPLSAIKNLEGGLTPSRRSLRKSVMPAQDYDEIILSKRNAGKENSQNDEHKWTPAKVGRVSHKRSTRKGRSGKKLKVGKNAESSDDAVHNSEDSEGKGYESKDIDKASEETKKEILNTTFDGENEDNTVVENVSEIANEMKVVLGEIDSSCIDDETEMQCYDAKPEVGIKESTFVRNAIEKEMATDSVALKIISESNELGCTPILYDNNSELEKGENEIDLDSALISNDETFEKDATEMELKDQVGVTDEDIAKEIFEELKEDIEMEDQVQEPEKDTANGIFEESKKDVEMKHQVKEPEKVTANKIFEEPKKDAEMKDKLKEPKKDAANEIFEELKEDIEMKDQVKELEKDAANEIFEESKKDVEMKDQLKEPEKDTANETFEESKKDVEMKDQVKESAKGTDNETFEETKKEVAVEKSEKDSPNFNKSTATVYESIDLASDDDMPSLILSDDEKVDADENAANDTFNMSDCVIVSPPKASVSESQLPEKEVQQIEKINLLAEAEKMVKELQENYFSPTLKTTKSVPKIILTNEKNVHEMLASTPRLVKKHANIRTPVSVGKRQNVETPVSTTKRKIRETPVSATKAAIKQPKGYRFPTPYKSKKDFRFDHQEKADKENEDQSMKSLQDPPLFTTLEPKEIVLRSIRKRSLSVTIDGDQRKRRALNVTFFSPANQTASIADLDEKLAKSAAKTTRNQNANQNVTTRKRSISLDEKYLRQQPSKLPRPVNISPQKQRPARTRLPNFSAIHKQQFEKMENLVDYVARKAERAQNLTNSALKTRNAASPAAKKQKLTAAKSLALTSNNKDVSSAGKVLVLTPNKNISNVAANNKSISEKLNKRTQRHMDMFKACPVDSKGIKSRNGEIIRGVRSNRRFELMMQHRKTSGN